MENCCRAGTATIAAKFHVKKWTPGHHETVDTDSFLFSSQARGTVFAFKYRWWANSWMDQAARGRLTQTWWSSWSRASPAASARKDLEVWTSSSPGCWVSQNHRMFGVGRDLYGSSSPTPCRSRVTQSRLHRTLSRWCLNISREGDSTAPLGSLFQCSITLRVKKFFLMFPWPQPTLHLLAWSREVGLAP